MAFCSLLFMSGRKPLATLSLVALLSGCSAEEGGNHLFGDSSSTTETHAQIADSSANPFVGTKFYLSPEFASNVERSQLTAAESLKQPMEKVKSYPTAIWLDSIGMIEGNASRMGIQAHLDEALRQQKTNGQGATPVSITFVVYNLPDRDCAAFASNGELKGSEGGLERYKHEYIDAIVQKFTQKPEYKTLKIIAVVEPDSLPNLVTNQSIPACVAAAQGYKEGVRYAVSQLSTIDNVTIYIDTSHSGWLGWSEHLRTAASVYQEVLGNDGLLNKIRGFATNVSNYTPVKEAFDPYLDPNQNRAIIENFYQWNRMIDELSFVNALSSYFPNKGFLIDTARNGWQQRGATGPSDQRTDRGNWCNITNAGIGERPQVNPAPHVDAYFWIKPPGESDGTSDVTAGSANGDGKRFDKMCGVIPVQRNGRSIPTDALQGAPHAGQWFDAGFQMLVKNATPPL